MKTGDRLMMYDINKQIDQITDEEINIVLSYLRMLILRDGISCQLI